MAAGPGDAEGFALGGVVVVLSCDKHAGEEAVGGEVDD